ncbi:MAG: hypothetical protein AAFV43_11455 [Planctomycetota bacterium]
MGPIGGIIGSAAGAPLSQTQGASAERSGRDAAAQERGVELDLKAEQAAGIGQTEGDQESSDRDADGRRMWEQQQQEKREQDSPDDDSLDEEATSRSPRDDEETGGSLDLVG